MGLVFPIPLPSLRRPEDREWSRWRLDGRAVDSTGQLRPRQPTQFQMCLELACLPPDSSADWRRTSRVRRRHQQQARSPRADQESRAAAPWIAIHCQRSKIPAESVGTPSKRNRNQVIDHLHYAPQGPHRLRSRAGQRQGAPAEKNAPCAPPPGLAARLRAGLPCPLDRKNFPWLQ